MPKDPFMLLSFVNMKLRDFYSDFESLCKDFDEDPEEIKEKLKMLDYEYNSEKNQFV